MKDKDSASKSNNEKSSEEVYTVSDTGLSEQFLDVAERIGNAIHQINKFSEPITSMRRVVEKFTPFFETLNSIEWDKVEEKWIQLVEDIGDKGWTVPLHLSLVDLFEIAELDTLDEVDNALMDFFNEEENYLEIKNEIMENGLLEDFYPLLKQCFDNYEQGQFLIVIPSLFSIVEGLAHKIIYNPYRETSHYKPGQKANIITKYTKTREEIESNSSDATIYISAALFISKSFENQSAFNDDVEQDSRPLIINRNRVLHGRDKPLLWKKADAMRLFNAIHTLSIIDLFNAAED